MPIETALPVRSVLTRLSLGAAEIIAFRQPTPTSMAHYFLLSSGHNAIEFKPFLGVLHSKLHFISSKTNMNMKSPTKHFIRLAIALFLWQVTR